MKKNLFILLLASLAITACQNDKAPATKAPAAAASASAASDAAPVQSQQPAAEQSHAVASANDTVAVTKPAETHAAQTLKTAMQESGDKIKDKLKTMQPAAMASNKPEAASAASAQNPVAQHAETAQAAVKAATDKKMPAPVPASAVPMQKHVAAVKASPIPKPVAISHPVAPAVPVVAAGPSGDAVKGKSLARKCAACHNFTAKKKVGPGLKGIVGRKAGIMPDMKYSADLAAGGWVWTAKHIAMWDCNSKKAIKVLSGNPAARTKMPPQRICDPQKQADLIAFLKTL